MGDLRVAFGVVAYFVMTWFVVPMSNAGNQQITFALPVTPVMTNGILIHIFGVGLPAAYFASREPFLIVDLTCSLVRTSQSYSTAIRCRR